MSILAFLPLIGNVLDRIIPDPQAAAQAKLQLLTLEQQGQFKELDIELQTAQLQTGINQVEAANANLFVSGWRPAIGWTCCIAFFAQFVGQPLLAWISPALHLPSPPPVPDYSALTPVLFGMLGLGGLRTYEKLKGVAK